jgi:hypothetical protein
MRRILTLSRCKCSRCIAARLLRLFALLGLSIAVVATARFLTIPPHAVFSNHVNIINATEEAPESPSREISLAEHSFPMIEPPNSRPFVVKSGLPDAIIPRELENAALAAGLVDPSKIDLTTPSSALAEATAQNDARAGQPEAALGATSQLNPGDLAVVAPPSAPAHERTEPAGALAADAPERNGFASAPPRRSAETVADESMPPLASRENTNRENYGSGARGAMKKASLRQVARTGIGALGNASAEERKALADYPRKGNKSEPPPSPRTGDRPPPPEDLSGDLRRFVADFVRTDQSNNVADQRRFYADSVHFYGEGDLSWTGVAAATRRYHQQEQTRRAEIAEPAATKGPVNGGFYVVEQPVVWTKTQGSQLMRGRSVLRLRVVPIDRGGWKITSIEETNR